MNWKRKAINSLLKKASEQQISAIYYFLVSYLG